MHCCYNISINLFESLAEPGLSSVIFCRISECKLNYQRSSIILHFSMLIFTVCSTGAYDIYQTSWPAEWWGKESSDSSSANPAVVYAWRHATIFIHCILSYWSPIWSSLSLITCPVTTSSIIFNKNVTESSTEPTHGHYPLLKLYCGIHFIFTVCSNGALFSESGAIHQTLGPAKRGKEASDSLSTSRMILIVAVCIDMWIVIMLWITTCGAPISTPSLLSSSSFSE